MTTIAYKDGVLAADSQCTEGGCTYHKEKKIEVCEGYITAGAGKSWLVHKIRRWLEKVPDLSSADFHDIGDEENLFKLLVFTSDFQFWEIDHTGIYELTDTAFFAVGSGEQFAYGAMAAGATSEEAVKAAIEFDIYSGGPVQHVDLRQTLWRGKNLS